MKESKLELAFRQMLMDHKLLRYFQQEYRFHPVRKWRLDFADPVCKIGVEIEGGTWVMGRHSRGSGYAKDCEKYNELAASGWRVFRYTSVKSMADFPEQYKRATEE